MKVTDHRDVERRVVGIWTDARFREPWLRRWRRYGYWMSAPLVGMLLISVGTMLRDAGGASAALGMAGTLRSVALAMIIALPLLWAFAGIAALVLTTLDVRADQLWGGARQQRGCCPACGQSLDGLLAEEDGCRVCPECGGAWRVASERGGS